MPFAALILVSLTAALSLIPTYCEWICPFKAVTEFEKVTSVESAAKAGVFISLFAGQGYDPSGNDKEKDTVQLPLPAWGSEYTIQQDQSICCQGK